MNKKNGKLAQALATAKKYWNEPAENCYVPYKEVVNLGIAGMGENWTITLASAISLSASSFLTGACIGLKPMDLQIMLIVANLVGLPIGLFRGWYFDNHHMKGGKFIPFMLRSSVPIFLISTIFVWLPYDNWSYIAKAVVVEIMYLLLQFFLCFYTEGYSYLQQIISPNAQERATVMSVSQIIYSFAPTVANFIIPTIAGLTYGNNNIWTYRVIYPAFTVLGLIINAIFFRKVKERLILPKKKTEYISTVDAIREVSKNKYFWIINIAGWIGFLESAYSVILGWSFVYAQNGDKEALLGTANTVIGNAGLWAMILAPIAIKAFGKRNLLIYCNLLNVVLLLLLLPFYKSLIGVCVIFYLNGFVNVFSNIYMPNINADMRDYHQWKTGVRVDGLFGPLAMIGTVIGFFTGLVVPAIYEKMGLHENYDVLYNDDLRNNLFKVLIYCSVAGAIVNLIPFLFYDLTEAKHRGYINVLKIRAMFEDYGNDNLDDNELCDAMEIINDARASVNSERPKKDKTALKQARALPKNTAEEKQYRKEQIKLAKAKNREVKKRNEELDALPIVLDELDKFSRLRYQKQLDSARETAELGRLHYFGDTKQQMKAARMLPHSTREEREIRSDAVNLVRSRKKADKLIKKYSAENIKEPDPAVKEEIENRDTSTLSQNLKARRDMKAFMKNRSVYYRACEPYDKAMTLITASENYAHLDELEKLYATVSAETAQQIQNGA